MFALTTVSIWIRTPQRNIPYHFFFIRSHFISICVCGWLYSFISAADDWIINYRNMGASRIECDWLTRGVSGLWLNCLLIVIIPIIFNSIGYLIHSNKMWKWPTAASQSATSLYQRKPLRRIKWTKSLTHWAHPRHFLSSKLLYIFMSREQTINLYCML